MNPSKHNGLSFFMAKVTRILFALFAFIILGFSLVSIQVGDTKSVLQSKGWLMVLLLAGCCFLWVLFTLFMESALYQKQKAAKGWICAVGALIVLFQLLFVGTLRIQLRYDSLEVFEEACNLLKTGKIVLWDYFGANAHQRGSLYFTWGLLKLASFFHIPESAYLLYLNLWCLFFVDSSLILTGYCVYQRKSWKGVSLFGLICLLNPFTYIWCSFYYTTIVCLPFMAAVLAAAVWFFGKKRTVKQRSSVAYWGAAAVLAVLCYVGNMIRPTVLIALIAFVCCGVSMVTKKEWTNLQWWKRVLVTVMIFGAVYFLCGKVYQKFDEKMVTIDTESVERPMLFWVAMGAKGDGTWDGNDAAYLAQFVTAEEKQEAATKLLQERLGDLDFVSALTLVGNKLRVTWAEGNDDFISENASSLCYGEIYDYLLGEKNGIFLYYCQLYRVFLFLVLAVNTLAVYKKRKFLIMDFARLAVLGGILFHIIWEAKRLYSLPFMPFMLLLLMEGITTGVCDVSRRTNKKSYTLLTIALCLSTVLSGVFLFCHGEEVTQKQSSIKRFTASQLMERCDIKRGLMNGEVVRQDFYADRPFNTIGVQVRNYAWFYEKENESVYLLTLTDATEKVLRRVYIYGKDFEDYAFSDTTFETVTPPGEGSVYHFSIETISADEISNLVFYKKAATAIDPYPWGDYVENGVRMENTDLTFRVYQEQVQPWMKRRTYILLGGIMIFAEVFLIFLFRKKKETPML